MKRNFYVASAGESSQDYTNGNLNNCINHKAFMMHEDTLQKGVFLSVNPNDVIFLKYNHQLVAYGEVDKVDTKVKPIEDWDGCVLPTLNLPKRS